MKIILLFWKHRQGPWRTSGGGDFDLCGFARPQLACRRILWGSDETYIVVRDPAHNGKVELLDRYAWPDVANSWTWPVPEGTSMQVEVYSAAEEVELLLNGKSMGRQPAGRENHNKACFALPYGKGCLEAVSYAGGVEVSRDTLTSAGEPAAVRIMPETNAPHQAELPADGQALCFARIEVVDRDGNPVPYVEAKATATVEGAAALAAFGTGRPATEENYTKGEITLYKGAALAIVRAGVDAGAAVLTVTAEGLTSATLELDISARE